MKVLGLFLCFLLLFTSSLASAQMFTYSKIDESVAVDNGANGAIGWGSCVTCAGGVATGTASHRQFSVYHQPVGGRGQPRFLYQRQRLHQRVVVVQGRHQ